MEIVLVGLAVTLVCTVFQCALVSGMLHLLWRIRDEWLFGPGILQATAILSTTLTTLLCGNLVQAAAWAFLFEFYGEFESFQRAFYFSLVNFTTLGYGDIVLKDRMAVLGPIESANGILMLGLTTSVLFAVLSRIVRSRFRGGDEVV